MRVTPRYDGPVLLEIAGPADDQLVPLSRQRRRFEATLAGLTADEWRTGTRCEGWTVQDVGAHLVGVNAFWEMSITAGLAGAPTRVLTNFDPAATPPLLIEPMRALPPQEVLARLVASHDSLLGLMADLDDAGWATPAETPAGHVPIRLLAFHALWDCWIHERDVAGPLGRSQAIEADEVASALRYAAAVGPALLVGAGGECPGRFAVDAAEPDTQFWLEVDDAVHVYDGAAPVGAACLRGNAVALTDALSVRAPLPADAPAEWHTLLSGLAAAFT
jgi:uncharacterized protein (TIGR03083 family)